MKYFDYSPPDFENLGQPQEFDIDEFLENSQEREKQRLEDELERIDQQLEQRDTIHEETIQELESKLDWYLDRLETLYKQHHGKREKREKVKSRITEFYRELREEKRSHWRDRQELERERRELLKTVAEVSDENWSELL